MIKQAGTADSFWGDVRDREAARQLGLSEGYTIVYMATDVGFIYDSADVVEQLDDLTNNVEEVRAAVDAAMRHVPLPKGFRMVGMRPRNSGPDAERVYGLVDFSALGAV